MAVKVIYNMQWSALKSKKRMCTEYTADSGAYFFLMKNISCFSMYLKIYYCHLNFKRNKSDLTVTMKPNKKIQPKESHWSRSAAYWDVEGEC